MNYLPAETPLKKANHAAKVLNAIGKGHYDDVDIFFTDSFKKEYSNNFRKGSVQFYERWLITLLIESPELADEFVEFLSEEGRENYEEIDMCREQCHFLANNINFEEHRDFFEEYFELEIQEAIDERFEKKLPEVIQALKLDAVKIREAIYRHKNEQLVGMLPSEYHNLHGNIHPYYADEDLHGKPLTPDEAKNITNAVEIESSHSDIEKYDDSVFSLAFEALDSGLEITRAHVIEAYNDFRVWLKIQQENQEYYVHDNFEEEYFYD